MLKTHTTKAKERVLLIPPIYIAQKQLIEQYIESLSFAEQTLALSIIEVMGCEEFVRVAVDIENSERIKDFDVKHFNDGGLRLKFHQENVGAIALLVNKEANHSRESMASWLYRVRAHMTVNPDREPEIMAAIDAYASYLQLERAAKDKWAHHNSIAAAVVCEIIEIMLDKFVGFAESSAASMLAQG